MKSCQTQTTRPLMLLELFCDVDDFLKFQKNEIPQQICSGKKQRNRKTSLSLSEIMTIVIMFHSSGYRNFKHFYLTYVCRHLTSAFPNIISYSRFIQLMPRVIAPMTKFLIGKLGECTGISIVDSTSIKVCHNKRIPRHKVFNGLAERSKSTMGWFYGFKLHIVINDKGEIIALKFTRGNVDDRIPVPSMTKKIFGKLFGDKGYLSSKLFNQLYEKGVKLVTTIKRNMKNKLMPYFDKIMLRKRFIIETINDKLKNECQIEHTRHRSPINFLINLLGGLITYQMSPKKPSLKVSKYFDKIALA